MLVMPLKEKKRREYENEEKYQNEITNLILNNYCKETIEGDSITINDCLKSSINLELCGKEIEQDIKCENEFDENEVTENMAGCDGVSSDKIAQSSVSNITGFMKVVANKKYLFEYDFKTLLNTTSRQIYFYDENKEFIKSTTGHSYIPQNARIQIVSNVDGYVKITYDRNVRNIKFYEEYTKYPSTKKESKLEFVEGNQEIIQTNTNLLGLGEYIEGFTQINIGTFHISSLGKSYLFETSKLPKIITFNAQNANRSNVSYYDDFPNENTQCKEFSTENSTIVPKTVEINKNYKYVLIQLSYQNEISNVQIEEGTNATGYIESKINKFQLTNLPKLYSKDDKIIYLKNEQQGIGWYSYNTYKVRKLLSTDIISKNDYGINSYLINISDIKNSDGTTINVMSNMFEAVKYDDRTFNRNDIIYANTSSKTIVVRNTEFKTVEEFKQFLNENDVYIAYKLVNPEYVKITYTALIEQLDNLRKIVIFKGTNNFIVITENGQYVNLKIKLYKDIIKILDDKISNLEQAILNS